MFSIFICKKELFYGQINIQLILEHFQCGASRCVKCKKYNKSLKNLIAA